jgi:hypothetical protein
MRKQHVHIDGSPKIDMHIDDFPKIDMHIDDFPKIDIRTRVRMSVSHSRLCSTR